MSKIHYLAYGSNLHPLRLIDRFIRSASVVDIVEMNNYRLAFHKLSNKDKSGKCLMYKEQDFTNKVLGVLYEFDESEKVFLDDAEGVGFGYSDEIMQIPLNGEIYKPHIYVAEQKYICTDLVPYHWYKALVYLGAQYHGFPTDYAASIEVILSKPDPDIQRTLKNESLLKQMKQFNRTFNSR